jgi:hypothetical protein
MLFFLLFLPAIIAVGFDLQCLHIPMQDVILMSA